MKNIYLTEEQKRKLSYAGKRLDEETEKELLIIMEDNCTKSEAVDHLSNGTVVYEKEEFEKFFDQYMNEWNCDEEEAEYKKMIESNEPININDWGVVEYEGKTYLISYVL